MFQEARLVLGEFAGGALRAYSLDSSTLALSSALNESLSRIRRKENTVAITMPDPKTAVVVIDSLAARGVTR